MSQLSKTIVKKGIYWFTNDLRLIDNPGFIRATQELDEMLCVFCLDPELFTINEFGISSLGPRRAGFLLKSLVELNKSLQVYGQELKIYFDSPLNVISDLISREGFKKLFVAKQFAYRETQSIIQIRSQNAVVDVIEIDCNTLFTVEQLPFDLVELPASFTKFRKKVENLELRSTYETPEKTPPSTVKQFQFSKHEAIEALEKIAVVSSEVTGGESAAVRHVDQYFSAKAASIYKKTRNSLDGWTNSTKFSFWLSNGCISPIQIMHKLQEYENTVEKNDSTYWIYFELLWREYFQWYALLHGKKLFLHKGIQEHTLGDRFDLGTYTKWCEGSTGFEIVDACMHELNATGYMSNRGRQIVASCFVNELNLDWRFGAAYFEKELIDYDVASNWGNWQYLAGVGADSRGKRHFNLEKQTATHDSDGKFRAKWL